jgi:hypothetical protein
MNAVLSHEYISTVLLPHIARVRSNPGLEHELAVLLMDNCAVHMHDDTLQELDAHRVKVVTFPLHTTNIFPSLDFSLFNVFKKRMAYKLSMDSDDSTKAFILRIFHNVKQTLVADNVRSAFVQIGVSYNIDVVPYRLIFDESPLRQS